MALLGSLGGMGNAIRDWFASHQNGDGDFFVAAGCDPFTVIPPRSTNNTIIYSTKKHNVLRLAHDLGSELAFGAVLRCGLPSSEDIDWLRTFVGSRRLIFLGDADPADLLTFALLREHLPIEYIGLTDQLLTKAEVEPGDHLTIALSDSEAAALPLLSDCFGELSSHLGYWCSSLLSSSRKIEVEALLSFANCSPSELQAALMVKSH